ncbi:vWA domain-containing protein [Streptomyces sp. NPDC004667]|uniref:vWA domain-containing protein n=1 Tax=Streptomyces sp. NPDC004667 TaxID=3154285 RepID=UPI0033A4AE31
MKHPSPPRASRFARAARGGAALVTAVLLAAPPATARATTTDPAPSRAEVYQALGLDDQPADYVVLVDTSGSMNQDGRYDTVRSTLGGFLNGMSPKDHVALFTFDSRPQPRYVGSAGDSAAIMSKLPAAPDPAGDTDIGAALDAALTELERDHVSAVASVVLLTDGEHHPVAGSGYPDSTGPAWTALRGRAQALVGRTELAGYALPLGNGATGAGLLGDVVKNTTVLRPDSIQDLGAYLARAGERTRIRKAQLLLAGDVGQGVTAQWQDAGRSDLTDGSATAKLTLRSTSRHVPLTVTGASASLGDPSVTLDGLPGQLTLQPGESRSFDVRLRGRLSAGPLPYRRVKDADTTLKLSGRVTSPWEPALAPDVRLNVPQGVRVTRAAVPLRATVGSAGFLPGVLGGGALVLLAGWLYWRRIHRPPLRGELLVTRVFGDAFTDRVVLTGRAVTLRPPSVGGRGRVRGRRRSTDTGPRIDLLIRYTPDGSTARESTATCLPDRDVVVNGVSFTYVSGRFASGPSDTFTGSPR